MQLIPFWEMKLISKSVTILIIFDNLRSEIQIFADDLGWEFQYVSSQLSSKLFLFFILFISSAFSFPSTPKKL